MFIKGGEFKKMQQNLKKELKTFFRILKENYCYTTEILK